ncbi:MAG TPA: fused MFS/spermidine synthase [bacterium]|nr:fused MFS/spermidine synthase [bacterium]
MPLEPRNKIAAIWFCFFLSGFSGLIYEVVWVRQFELVFGTGTYAVGAILTAFMAGLSLGGLAGGKADKALQPLKIYGWLEISIGVYALLFPTFFKFVQSFYLFLETQRSLSVFESQIIRFLSAFALLILPTTMMGATLPFLSKVVSREPADHRWSVGRLYGVNTAGAVLGVLFSGFWILPHFGQARTLFAAAFLNLGLGAAVLWLNQNSGIHFQNFSPWKTKTPPESQTPWNLALIIAALSGYSAMTYESCYNRVLAMTLGGSVYAFTTMLATFLAGLGFGALAVTGFWSFFQKKTGAWLAAILVLAGVTALFTGFIFDRLGYLFLWLYQTASSFGFELAQSQRVIQFFVSAAVMMPTALFLGSVFPLAIQMDPSNRIGHWVGKVYSWNTLGAIGGAFLASFIFIPLLGIELTLLTGAFAHLAAGVWLGTSLLHSSRQGRWIWVTVILAGVLLLFSFLPGWNLHRMAIGPYLQIKYLRGDLPFAHFIDGRVEGTDLLFYREGVSTTVTVEKNRATGSIFLSNNGKPEASSSTDLATQHLLSDLPLLWFASSRGRQVRQAAVIGLASGITSGAALQHPMDQLTTVELEPFMLPAAALFHQYNFQVLENPKFQLVLDDGRHFLEIHPGKFDVIISEPSNPWISGVSNLFTRESFETSHRGLTDGGVFCQWVQVYEMKLSDLKAIVRTFHSVFPNTYLFGVPPRPGEKAPASDVVLLGSVQPLRPSLPRFDELIKGPRIERSLDQIGIHESGDLVSLLRMGPVEISKFEKAGPLNTDDNALIEFSTPLSLYEETYYDDMMEIRKYQCDPTAEISGGSKADLKRLMRRVSEDLFPYWRRDLAIQLREKAERL